MGTVIDFKTRAVRAVSTPEEAAASRAVPGLAEFRSTLEHVWLLVARGDVAELDVKVKRHDGTCSHYFDCPRPPTPTNAA